MQKNFTITNVNWWTKQYFNNQQKNQIFKGFLAYRYILPEKNISNREVISEPFVPKRQGGWSPCGRGQSLDRINAINVIKIDEDTKIKSTSTTELLCTTKYKMLSFDPMRLCHYFWIIITQVLYKTYYITCCRFIPFPLFFVQITS